MYTLAKVSIFINILAFIKSTYLEAELNYRPKVERNNILNKGLWVSKITEPHRPAPVFKTYSFDIDDLLDNGESLPFFTGYVSRNKRSIQKPIESQTNNSKDCENNGCSPNENKRDISKLKSTSNSNSIVNDSINKDGLLSHTDHYNILHNIPPHIYTPVDPNTKYYITNITKDFEKIMKPIWINTKENALNPQKSIKSNDIFYSLNDANSDSTNASRNIYESPLLQKIVISEKFNNSMKNILNKNVLKNNQLVWQQNAPTRLTKPYNTSENRQETTKGVESKIISEKGLLNVLAMLTRTFKRIMKQHNVIKLIHNKLHNLNSDIMTNLQILTKKFEDFDIKYNQIMRINKDFNETAKIINDQRQTLMNKEKELSNNLIEFGKQQKEFIKQQSQFYNIQKEMLKQNEKNTNKQAQIAKIQNDISVKHNYISKLLKKMRLPVSTSNAKEKIEKKVNAIQTSISSITSPLPESIKIDLFAIPRLSELNNNDKDMLKDKDEQSIDDLIYKYYFNNTFLAEMIKNKLFATVVNASDSKHYSKKRKPHSTTTLLLPISSFGEPKHRERRWIRRPKKKTHKVKSTTLMPHNTDLKFSPTKKEKPNTDPFLKMAMTFCTELDQKQNVQAFNWCVEKALRRLQVIDVKMISTPDSSNNSDTNNTEPSFLSDPLKLSDASVTPAETFKLSYLNEVTTETISAKFFPDNDELETNLKQYEIKPDLEGNVYFDGSLHVSDITKTDAKDLDSDGFSDIMPGLDSNSRVDVDPTAIELQAQRRAEVRRINRIKA